jgi:pimeloyl-ACP methyl ester carboxylesterase
MPQGCGKGYPRQMADPDISEVHFEGLTGRIHASRRPAGTDGRSAPTFVLVHGIGTSHRYLHRLHRLLAETAETYSVELPGFGSTPKPDRRLSMADYAGFLRASLDQAGVGPCVLIGHSMGTQLAVEAARQEPGRFTQLVLMGPVVDSRRRTVARQAFDLAVDCLFFESPSSNLLVLADYFRCGPRWYLTELPVMMAYPTEQRIAEVDAPVLVLRGFRDTVASRDWCRRLAGRAMSGEFREIPGSGHVVQHTASGQVAQAIRDFVASPGRALESPA